MTTQGVSLAPQGVASSPANLALAGFMDPDTIISSFGVNQGMKIADFGSGAGYFTIALAKIVGPAGTVSAIDILENTLEALRAKASLASLDNIRTIRANLEVVGSSGINDNSQDLVLLKNIIYQSQNKQALLSEAARVLRENGRMIVIDWQKGAGGLGPPDNLRTESGMLENTILALGFKVERSISVDAFHYGFIFRKIIRE